jgi:hypothetical protein
MMTIPLTRSALGRGEGRRSDQRLAVPRRDSGAHEGAASVASFLAAILTEMYLCNVCSCQEILRRNGPGQACGYAKVDDVKGEMEKPPLWLERLVRRALPAAAWSPRVFYGCGWTK